MKPKNSIERWQRLAEEGDPAAQYSLGNAYGEPGVTQNSVLAYMWLSLAARTSWFFDHAAPLRDLEGELLTSDELAEAERLVREWKPTVE